MNLEEALKELQLAVTNLGLAYLSDDKTPLLNNVALSRAAGLVGTGEGNPDVVIFADLNRFKDLNDRLGHLAGDAAISSVGKLIHDLIAQPCGATAYRRSGDEFVILLSNTVLDLFTTAVASFAGCKFPFEGTTHETAMSFGYAVCEGEIAFTDLLARAEAACQAAKFQGDGTCLEWSPDMDRSSLLSIRGRCVSCGTQVIVSTPREAAPDGRLRCCPCCGKSFDG